ncbi:MAG: HEAT repeat domain-containing protein [Nostoc indistinguendum CM1-VF10]|nr:HEAT repeat domain-containing protein [Nostoc indistinguendum CM1-VF10]
MTLAVLGAITSPLLMNPTALAQTRLVEFQCTDVEINQHIQQLNKGESTNLEELLVACKSKAVPALIKTLENQDENPRIIAIAALGTIGAEAALAVPVLNGLIKDKRENIRIVVVSALGQIIGKDGVRPLIQVLKDKNENVRSSAANALGIIGKDAVPALTIALKNPDSNIRAGAADALGQIGIDARATVPYLTIAFKDPDSTVRSAATNALEKIKKSVNDQQEIEDFRRRCRFLKCSSTAQIRQIYLEQSKPPAMCKIPIIKAVLRWKCL